MYNVAPLVALIETDIEPKVMATKLADISYRYAVHSLKDNELDMQADVADDLFYLQLLRERFMQITEKEKP